MTPARRAITLLGAALLAVSLPPPAAAAEPDSGHDVTLAGEPITGGANWGDAIELASGGQYLDEFTESVLHYRIPRQIEGSTIHVGVTALGQGEDADPVQIEIGTWDGETCASNSISATASGYSNHLRSTHLATVPDFDDEDEDEDEDPCTSDEEIIMTVELNGDPEELRSLGEPVQLLIFEEPPPTNSDQLPEVSDGDDDWEEIGRDISGAESITPGTSFEDAPLLEPGTTYDVEIHPGQIQFFRMPLEWGQRLQAEAHFPEPVESLAEDLEDMGDGALMVLNPMRGSLAHSASFFSTGSATQLRVHTEPIQWFNREGSAATLAGDHHLVVSTGEHETGADFPMHYRLTTQTFGEADDGAPVYPDGHEDARPGFGASGSWAGGAAGQGWSGVLERIRGLGDNAAVVAVLATSALLMMGAGSWVMVRLLRRSEPR